MAHISLTKGPGDITAERFSLQVRSWQGTRRAKRIKICLEFLREVKGRVALKSRRDIENQMIR